MLMQVHAYPYAIALIGATAYSLSTWVPEWMSVLVYGKSSNSTGTGTATTIEGSKKTE